MSLSLPPAGAFPGASRHRVPGASRRQVLSAFVAGLGAAGLAGCRSGASPTGPDPLLADLADEQRLVAAYEATARRHPTLDARLRPLRANHAAHVDALVRAVGTAASTSASTATATVTPGQSAVPATPAAAVAALDRAEWQASAARAASAVRATGGRAALLASMAACSACHRVVLLQ
jgi:hypothetical protein